MKLIGSPLDIGDAQTAPMPTDDADYTWHIHDEDEAPTKWGTGVKCEECLREKPDHTDGKHINFAISRLQNTNQAGVTQHELRQEIYDNARQGGYDITRA